MEFVLAVPMEPLDALPAAVVIAVLVQLVKDALPIPGKRLPLLTVAVAVLWTLFETWVQGEAITRTTVYTGVITGLMSPGVYELVKSLQQRESGQPK